MAANAKPVAPRRLQQHHRVRARQEAGHEVRQLELADRQRGDDHEAAAEAVTQRRHHDVQELAPSRSAKRLRGLQEDFEPQVPHVGHERLHDVGERQHHVPRDEDPEAAQIRERVAAEDEDEAEGEASGGTAIGRRASSRAAARAPRDAAP